MLSRLQSATASLFEWLWTHSRRAQDHSSHDAGAICGPPWLRNEATRTSSARIAPSGNPVTSMDRGSVCPNRSMLNSITAWRLLVTGEGRGGITHGSLEIILGERKRWERKGGKEKVAGTVFRRNWPPPVRRITGGPGDAIVVLRLRTRDAVAALGQVGKSFFQRVYHR